MDSLLISVILAAFYLEAGRRTWHVLLLVNPDGANSEIIRAQATGDLAAYVIKGVFLAFWPMIMAYGWIAAKLNP